MRYRIQHILIILAWLCLSIVPGTAQDELPREYIPEGEILSMNSDLDIGMAFELLSDYAIESSGKPIYDPTDQRGTIGIDVKQLPWRKALETILSRRGLWYKEQPHFIQIVERAELEESSDDRLFKELKIRPGQREIKIETIFFEGDRKKLSEIGIDWSTFHNGQVDVTANQLGAFQVTEEIFDVTVKVPGKLFGVDVQALIKAFDSNDIGTVLAQPQVTVTEGNVGKVQVGQDFSIKTRDYAGNIMDRFYSTGTILEVTPYILEDDQGRLAIVLRAHVERSNAKPDVVSTIINKSEANSLIQLYDGEETIIAGLYSTETSKIRKGIPLLKDLPWWFLGLRYLFGYNRTNEAQKELIIIIKASLLPKVYARAESNFINAPSKRNPVRELSKYSQKNYGPQAQAYFKMKDKIKADDDNFERSIPTEPDNSPNASPVKERNENKPGIPPRSEPGIEPELASASDESFDTSPRNKNVDQDETAEKNVSDANSESVNTLDTRTVAEEKIPARESVATVDEQGYSRIYRVVEKEPDDEQSDLESRFYFGRVKYAKNGLVLIHWNKDVDPEKLHGEKVTIFRKNGEQDIVPIAKMSIVRSKGKSTAAGSVSEKASLVKSGDLAGILLGD